MFVTSANLSFTSANLLSIEPFRAQRQMDVMYNNIIHYALFFVWKLFNIDKQINIKNHFVHKNDHSRLINHGHRHDGWCQIHLLVDVHSWHLYCGWYLIDAPGVEIVVDDVDQRLRVLRAACWVSAAVDCVVAAQTWPADATSDV